MKIFLLGLPGSGKTTLGIKLSKALKVPCVDLDREIEKGARQKIRKIFAERGEAEFRKLEAAELARWCNESSEFVMATGGGAPCFFDNMERILAAGTSVFLDVSPGELVRRMERTPLEERPLLSQAGADELLKKLEALRVDRLPYYSRATFTIAGNSLTVDSILELVENPGP